MYSHKIKVNQEIRMDINMSYNTRNSVSLHLFEVFVFFSSKVNFRGCLLIANITKEFRNGMNLIVINEDGHFILRGLLGRAGSVPRFYGSGSEFEVRFGSGSNRFC